MRARGFDRSTIQEACETRDRGLIADQLIARIDAAFDGVVLGGGVGLQQAQGLDDFEDEVTLAAYRSGDEKDDWRKIPADALNSCNSSLTFFDADGMKFHLPAYMTADLRGEYRFRLAFSLTQLGEHCRTLGLQDSETEGTGQMKTLPNKPHALNPAIGLWFQFEYHWRGASDAER